MKRKVCPTCGQCIRVKPPALRDVDVSVIKAALIDPPVNLRLPWRGREMATMLFIDKKSTVDIGKRFGIGRARVSEICRNVVARILEIQ